MMHDGQTGRAIFHTFWNNMYILRSCTLRPQNFQRGQNLLTFFIVAHMNATTFTHSNTQVVN